LLDSFLRWQFQDYPFSVNSAFEDILFQQVPANKPTILYMNFPCGRKYRKIGLVCQSNHGCNIWYGALMILEKVYSGLRFFDTEVLVLAVCNEGLLGHYPGGPFNNSTLLAAVKPSTGALHVSTYSPNKH
jgi:hypothetical protein